MKDLDSAFQRIKYFLQTLKITKAEFYRNCNLSNGYLDSDEKSMQSDKLENISKAYPNLNMDWVITGNGSMLVEEEEEAGEDEDIASDFVSIRIRLMIVGLGLKVNSFCEKVGINPSVMHNIVAGRRSKPSFELLRQIKAAFPNIDINWIVTGERSMFLDDTPTPPLVTDSPVEYRQVDGDILININLKINRQVL